METVINQTNIAGILSQGKPVLVDFWAPWCGPCRALAPVVEQVASEIGDKAVVGKCNVDECEDLAAQYGIRNIPTLLFFGKDGALADRTVGVVSGKDIIAKLESLL